MIADVLSGKVSWKATTSEGSFWRTRDDDGGGHWKLVLRSLKTKRDPGRRLLIEKEIRRVAGAEIPLPTARKELLLIVLDAVRGRPRLLSLRGEGIVCVIALEDLLEDLVEPGPSLVEVMRDGGRGPQR